MVIKHNLIYYCTYLCHIHCFIINFCYYSKFTKYYQPIFVGNTYKWAPIFLLGSKHRVSCLESKKFSLQIVSILNIII